MADNFRQKRPADPLDIPASVYNEMLRALQWVRQQQNSTSSQSSGQPLRPGQVLVRNDSGADQQQYAVLGISGLVVTPDHLPQFKTTQALTCIVPTVAAHTGKFVVLADPIPQGKFGRAWVSGVFACQVDIQSASHTVADVKDNTTASLKSSSAGGGASILWAESGTGLKWALVRIGSSGAKTSATVQLGSNAPLGGTYYVTQWQPPTADIVLTGSTFTSATLGTGPGTPDGVLFNLAEIGQTTHDLTAASPAIVLVDCQLWYTNADGTKIFVAYIVSPGC